MRETPRAVPLLAAGPDALQGLTGSTTPRPHAPDARLACQETRAACGCPGHRSPAQGLSWAAQEPTAGCKPRVRRDLQGKDLPTGAPPAPTTRDARDSRERKLGREHPDRWQLSA